MKRVRAGWREVALVAGSVLFTIGGVEIFARIWVAARWPAERITQMTADGPGRGRYEIGPLGYSLRKAYRYVNDTDSWTHNTLGFRGPEIPTAKPAGQVRVVLMGASTIYGLVVSDHQTSSVHLQENLRSLVPDVDVVVINAGVPGWTSQDTVASFESRVLPLDPDIVLMMDGRNDIVAQSFRAFVPNYSHYVTRDPEIIAAVQGAQRKLFRSSHAAMLVTHRVPSLFGYRPELFFPVYASVVWENQPTPDEAVAFSTEPPRRTAFADHLRAFVELVRNHGATPVLATISFIPGRFESDLLPRRPDALKAMRRVGVANVEATRRVAAELDVALVEGYGRVTPDLMVDDCHPTGEGEKVLGREMASVIAPLIPRAAPFIPD